MVATAARSIHVRCKDCGQLNRVPVVGLQKGPRCGSCKNELRAQQRPIEVNSADLETLVAEATAPVLVDFWAAWCGPCRAMAPELERFANTVGNEVLVAKLDTDANPDAASKYNARSIPFLVLFSGGNPVWSTAGARPSARLVQEVRAALTSPPQRWS